MKIAQNMLETSLYSGGSVSALSQGGYSITSSNVKESFSRFYNVLQKDEVLNQQALDKGLKVAFENNFDADKETQSRIIRLGGAFKGTDIGSDISFLALEITQKNEKGETESLYFSLSGESLDVINTGENHKNGIKTPLLSSSSFVSLNNADSIQEALEEDDTYKTMQRIIYMQKALEAYRKGDLTPIEAYINAMRDDMSDKDTVRV